MNQSGTIVQWYVDVFRCHFMLETSTWNEVTSKLTLCAVFRFANLDSLAKSEFGL